tara:strand:+ start:103 stop:264 length:162 start_codon:yes stop_codon:yes gene_type:complete
MKFKIATMVLLLILSSCGFKTRISCQVEEMTDIAKELNDRCWQKPEIAIKKEF